MSSLPKLARRAVAVFAVAFAACAVAVVDGDDDGATARAAANVTITARDFFWSPDAVTIQVGDTVTWTNEQGFHNVLLGDSRLNQPGFPNDPAWQPSPQMTFDTPGSYTYLCEVHPGMTGTVAVAGGEPTPTPTPSPTPAPAVPPPGSAAPDSTAPVVSNITVSGSGTTGRVRLTVSERSTVNVRFVSGDEVLRLRSLVEQGTWTLERELATGRYAYELWAVDAMGNRSVTHVGEVTIRG